MNKRFVQFLHELAEENEELESKYANSKQDNKWQMEEIREQRKTIAELKAKVRLLKKEVQK
jgi:DNA repair exonuclease SbcCD ATPase subunit